MDDHDDTSGDVGTPVAEYQLAGSPRQLTTSSPSSAQPNSAFKLKSPFNRRRQETESKSEEIAPDSSTTRSGPFVDVMGDEFARQVVDVVVLDSPQSSVGHSLGLNEIREEDEAALMEEEVGADDDEEYHVGNHPDSGNRHSLHPGSGIQNQSGVHFNNTDKTDKVDATNNAGNTEDNDEDLQFQDEEYRYVYLNNAEANARFGYCCNLVITSRFTVYNFIPKLLFYEFKKLANAYFLIISIMQTIKPISNTGGFPASLPALSIIVLIDMFFACLEDYKRHTADTIANELPCRKYNVATRAFDQSKWQLLHVGDIVKVHNREPVPADLVILAACEPDASNPAGICYVETKSLDGETNLKLRQGLEATYTTMLSDAQVGDMNGVVVCEKPNNSIHRFSGTLSLANGQKEVISTNAILLRGSTLRNTEYIYGLVVNTGPDTKIMMASSSAPMKWSNMEKRLNQQIMYICTLMVVLCLTGAILSSLWNAANLSESPRERAWYLFDKDSVAVRAPAGNFVIQVLYYFLLLNSFIPVSLYVSMTSVKFMQAYFMNNDLEMYHDESDTPCSVRTMSLNEELGQIDYIFSDKTGTLTCNIMEFRKCSINGVSYGHGQTEVGIAAQKRRMAEGGCDATDMMATHCTIMEEDSHHQENNDEGDGGDHDEGATKHRAVKAPFVNYQDDSLFEALRRQDKHADLIHAFFEHLAVCHTVMPERASDGSVRLSASSPDEQALVAAAACFGFKFTARAPGKAMVEYFSCLEEDGERGAKEPPPPTADASKGDATNRVGEYQILEVLEFNSTRKRMSVIMRGPTGELKLLCKGADTVMYERLRVSSDPHDQFVRAQTLQHMETFASDGLRTLVIGATDVDPTFYDEWVVRYRSAINDMRQIELRRLGDANEIDRCMEEIEVDLDVLGATAIEDKLQAGVPDTIHRLRQASIKIWMLTGDKEETAINIGFACRLLTPDIERVVISADTHPDLVSIVDELESYADHPGGDPATDMDGPPSRHRGKTTSSSVPAATNPNASAATNADGSASDDSTSEADTRPLTRIESIANLNACQENGSALALVIDGETLELALDECPLLLLRVALKCVAVIACRVSPAQKAQLVQLVRDNHPKVRTLAIGDGANDVSMIQSAHVGVGISGQEGMQAANSSDYAIAQFRFLSRLLLVHGRWNYVRMGKLILYIFYKNVMMNLTQFWYMIFTGFSGQKFFLEWGLQGYNLMFTALPIVLISTFEQDVPAYYAHNYPVLYRVGQENSHFNTKIVWAWISSCVWESLVISFGTIFGMRLLIDGGETPNMWVYGCVAFTIVTLVVTLKLCLHQQMWWPLIHLPIYFVSYSLWIATAAFISYGNSVSSAYWNGVFTNVFGTKVFWLLLPLIVLTALSRDFLWKGYMRAFHPSYKHLAQEVNAFGLKHMADYLLSFPPPTSIPRDDSESGAARPSAATTDQTTSKKKQSKKEAAVTQAAAAAAARLHATGTGGAAGARGARGLGAGSSGGLGASRRSFTRGSAFSYDAESVMVESFMATDRYHHDAPHETKPMFERHASRGSMAFHTFMGDGPSLVTSWMGSFIGGSSSTNQASMSLPAHPSSSTATRAGAEAPPGALANAERQHSAGNVFRGARHSFGRRRFFSVSTTGSGAAAASTGDLRAGLEHGGGRSSSTTMGGGNRNLRRYERALSGDAAGANASAPHLTATAVTTTSRPNQDAQAMGERHSSVGTRAVRRHTTSATPRKMSA